MSQISELEKKSLPSKELNGLLNLLQDSEETTLDLIANQIRKFDHESLRTLDDMAQDSENKSLTDNWYYVSKQSLLFDIKEWSKVGELEAGLFLIARLDDPGVDKKFYSELLDEYAQRVKARINPELAASSILQVMNQVLFEEESFMGNQISYYDLKNNFINTVINRKTGNPIMVSSIYILIGRRLGLDIQGIGTPGHFIVKFEDKFYDPFFGGKEITKQECVIRAQELGVYWKDEYLDPIDDKSIVSRAIRNLIAIYKKQNELEKAADASEVLRSI